MRRTQPAAIAVLACGAALAGGPAPAQEHAGGLPDPETPRPIAARDSVFIEELTWMEVRDALRGGSTTALVIAGGLELGGPYLPLGRRNALARATAAAVARLLGDALVAPVLPIGPAPDPGRPLASYPGAIYVSEDAFRAVVRETVESLAQHGFEEIVILGDGAASQPALAKAHQELAATALASRVHYVPEFGDEAVLARWTQEQGIVEQHEGLHDDFATSAMLMAVAPDAVRMEQRLARGLFSINGVSLAPAYTTAAFGRELIQRRARLTADAIRQWRETRTESAETTEREGGS